MAKRIKLQDRSGVQLLPLTRAELVQFTYITGLVPQDGTLSVQAALEALNTKANNIAAAEGNNLTAIETLQSKLQGIADSQNAVKIYVDEQDTAYLALAYAEAAAKATEAQTNSYAWAEAKASEAQSNSYDYADGKFLVNVKLNNDFVIVQSDANGRYVDLGSIATSTGLETLSDKVDAIETAYVAKDNEIVSSYTQADTAIITAYETADSAIVSSYTAADSAIITAYEAADTALSNRITTLETGYTVTLAEADGSGDIAKVYTISQGGATVGTINIPKDMVATKGELKYGTLSGNTFTEAAGGDPYIKMTVGNGNTTDTFYIPVADLIEYNTFTSGTEIGFTDNAHNVSAYIGTIAATKISYNDTTVDAAIANLYSQVGEGGSVTTQIQNALDALDASYTASGTAAHDGTFVMNAVTQTDGKIVSIGSVEVEAAGAAATAKGTIDNYTVNGKKISTNPVLGATDILFDSTSDVIPSYQPNSLDLEGDISVNKALSAIDEDLGNVYAMAKGAVKSVNGQTPATNGNGAVTVNANQINTVNTYKIGSETSATTHKVDEVLAAAVLYVDTTGNGTYADTTI